MLVTLRVESFLGRVISFFLPKKKKKKQTVLDVD